jgi:hypothetical protein
MRKNYDVRITLICGSGIKGEMKKAITCNAMAVYDIFNI